MKDDISKNLQTDMDDGDELDLEILEFYDDIDDYIQIGDVDEIFKDLNRTETKPRPKTTVTDEMAVKALRKKKLFREIVSFAEIFIVAIILAYIISFHIIVNATVPTGSMSNTILPGDRVIGMRLAYVFGEPKRGDIIIFHFPDNEEEIYIKRIIGLPGDTVEIRSGRLYINDELYIEDYIREPMNDYSYGPYSVPDDSYFVLGDNRNHSIDSRFWTNTYVHKDKILGKAVIKYWKSLKFLD